ncbi:hypothetical protein EYF80_012922 [Liparis tanakae]|uniref:Uncharacterized protein n=1 Tax=Liparis tanakae TaxID=230148 RepID=A0A4Z2IFP3_9TELE|nr:hypothetical protein EYF80_012922 [Liparis tanakae]
MPVITATFLSFFGSPPTAELRLADSEHMAISSRLSQRLCRGFTLLRSERPAFEAKLTRVMNSFASSEMSVNSSSSKFHWQARMLFNVSLSSSPRNGDKPLSLRGYRGQGCYCPPI